MWFRSLVFPRRQAAGQGRSLQGFAGWANDFGWPAESAFRLGARSRITRLEHRVLVFDLPGWIESDAERQDGAAPNVADTVCLKMSSHDPPR